MTALGARKHNATGRSIGQRKTNKRTKIQGQFAPRLIEMLHSPAYRVLSLSAHRILGRLEIELANHGGADNGRLPCTYENFVRYGIHRHSIAAALRELEVLGFIEITERGRAGNAEFRSPNLFRLRYRNTSVAGPTDEWRRFKTLEQAKTAASRARKQTSRKKDFNDDISPISVSKTVTEATLPPMLNSVTTSPVSISGTTLDISGHERAQTDKPAGRERGPQSRSDRPAAELKLFKKEEVGPRKIGDIIKADRDWLLVGRNP